MIYIYHHTDDDGYASAATVITYLLMSKQVTAWNDDRIKLIRFNYEKLDTFLPMQDFKIDDSIYMVDLSVSTGTLEKFLQFINVLCNRKCSFTWIDHHRSSIDKTFEDLLNKRFKIYGFEKYLDNNYCAAYNCYKYLINQKLGVKTMPEIIRVIDDYDCWKLKLEHTKEFIVGFSLEDKHNPANSEWYNWLTVRGDCLKLIRDCIHYGQIVNKWLAVDDTIKYNGYAFETTLCGLKCCALNVRRNADIFRLTDEVKYSILLSYIYDGNEFIYSVYSTDPDVYCNKVAELFGGGGHKGAAGFRSKKLIVNKTQNLRYKLKDKKRAKQYQNSIKNRKE